MKVQDPIYPGAALAAGKKVAPDAINLLILEHRQVMFYFEAYEAANDLGRVGLERMIGINLLAHMAMEEEIFYPTAQALSGDEELVGASYEDHEEAKQIIERLATERLDSNQRLVLMRELQQAVLDHIETEETELFPKLREAGLDGVTIGMAMAARRPEVLSALTGKPIPFAGVSATPAAETNRVH